MANESKLFDAAKKATESAAAKASELTRSATDTTETVRDIAAGVKDQLADASAEIKALSSAKLNEALADFNAALPILREAGYVLDGVNIKIGLTPQIIANFAGGAVVSEERVDAILTEHAERPLTTLLVKAVRHATTLQSKLSIKGMRADGLAVEVGLIPQVTVKFSPTTYYFGADQAPIDEPTLLLDGDRREIVANTVVMSNAAPEYAPAGKSLIAASSVGVSAPSGASEAVIRVELARMYGVPTDDWELLSVVTLPHALPAANVPQARLRKPVALGDGLFVAGDHRDSPSIQGALASGWRTAGEVLSSLGAPVSSPAA